MATVVNNDLTAGLSGRVGKFIVFRTFGGKTIASHAPRKPDPSKQSVAQRQTRSHFREAAAWAVQTLKDSQRREYYFNLAKAEGLPNAYTAALKVYMRGEVAKNGSRIEDHSAQVIAAVQDPKPAETSTHIHSGADRSHRVRIQNQLDSHLHFRYLQKFTPGGGDEFRKLRRTTKPDCIDWHDENSGTYHQPSVPSKAKRSWQNIKPYPP